MHRYYVVMFSEQDDQGQPSAPVHTMESTGDVHLDELMSRARDEFYNIDWIPSPCLIEVIEFKEVEGRLVSSVVRSESISR